MKKPNTTITQDEWLAAYDEALAVHDPHDASAFSSKALADRWKCSHATAQRRLSVMVKNGRAVQTFQYTTNTVGVRIRIPVYKLKK